MKKIVLLIFLLTSVSVFGKNLILVTYFEPFGEYKKNNSKEMAVSLRDSLQLIDYEVHLCELPVVFHAEQNYSLSDGQNKVINNLNNSAYSKFQECLKNKEYKFVLSLGIERNFKFEFVASNLMGIDQSNQPNFISFEDNDQNIFDELYVIDRFGVSAIASEQKNIEAFCQSQESNLNHYKVKNFSSNMGFNVCNNLSYHIMKNNSDLNFQFVHIPYDLKDNREVYKDRIVKFVRSYFEGYQTNQTQKQFKTCMDLSLSRAIDAKNYYEGFIEENSN